MTASIRHLNVLLTLVKLEPDPARVSRALEQRLRWARGQGSASYWKLVREVPHTTLSTRELIESQYDRG